MTETRNRVRALLIDYNVRYLNPTRNNLVKLLTAAFDLSCFGPGYTNEEIARCGIEKYVDHNGPFDLILATEHVVFWGPHISPRGYQRCYSMNFDASIVADDHKLKRFFLQYAGPKLSVLLETDFYSFQPEQVEILEKAGGHVAAWGAEFIPAVSTLGGATDTVSRTASDCWREFALARPERLVSALHFITPSEFCESPHALRKKTWNVLGAAYPARAHARRSLAAAGISCEWRRQALKVRVCSRLFHARIIRPDWLIETMQKSFQATLADTCFGYTCGSPIRAPIRKFFEIPAAGCLLVCLPFHGAADCGFVEGKNFLACQPEELPDLHESLLADPDRIQVIADAGRQMVLENHSLSSRATQLAKAGAAIAQGKFKQARWVDGCWEMSFAE